MVALRYVNLTRFLFPRILFSVYFLLEWVTGGITGQGLERGSEVAAIF